MLITSRNNQKIKDIIKLRESAAERERLGMYVVEGPRMVSEIPEADIVSVYVSESYLRKQSANLTFESEKVIETQDIVFEKLSDTKNPQGILAVVKMHYYDLSDIATGAPILLLEGIQDPGNLGTMFRSGEAAGIGGLILDKNTVNPYNSKVIRSTMGAFLRVPHIISEDLSETIDTLKAAGYTIYAAHLKGERSFTEEKYERAAFLIGNEGAGLSDKITEKADKLIKIPMEGAVESLNAAVSASLLVYECHRQRWES